MNNLTEKEKQAVKELIDELKKLYGDNLSRVILYGSKARGDATEDSDIDIMIVLKDVKDKSKELEKVIKLTTEIDFRYETLISVTLQSEEEYLKKRSPLLLNVRKEGIVL
jgi:predicted nucleotidyltransferase